MAPKLHVFVFLLVLIKSSECCLGTHGIKAVIRHVNRIGEMTTGDPIQVPVSLNLTEKEAIEELRGIWRSRTTLRPRVQARQATTTLPSPGSTTVASPGTTSAPIVTPGGSTSAPTVTPSGTTSATSAPTVTPGGSTSVPTATSTKSPFDDPNFIPGEFLDPYGNAKFIPEPPIADTLTLFVNMTTEEQDEILTVIILLLLALLLFIFTLAFAVAVFAMIFKEFRHSSMALEKTDLAMAGNKKRPKDSKKKASKTPGKSPSVERPMVEEPQDAAGKQEEPLIEEPQDGIDQTRDNEEEPDVTLRKIDADSGLADDELSQPVDADDDVDKEHDDVDQEEPESPGNDNDSRISK